MKKDEPKSGRTLVGTMGNAQNFLKDRINEDRFRLDVLNVKPEFERDDVGFAVLKVGR